MPARLTSLYPIEALLLIKKEEDIKFIESVVDYLQNFKDCFEAENLLEETKNYKALLLRDSCALTDPTPIVQKFTLFCEKVQQINQLFGMFNYFTVVMEENVIKDTENFLKEFGIALEALKTKFSNEMIDKSDIALNESIFSLEKFIFENIKNKYISKIKLLKKFPSNPIDPVKDRKENLNDKIHQLLIDIECIKDDAFNKLNAMDLAEKYRELDEEHAILQKFDRCNPLIATFLSKTRIQTIPKLQKKINKLAQLNELAAVEKYHLLSHLYEKLEKLEKYNRGDITAYDPESAIEQLKTLLSTENCVKLSQHRNTPFKSAFWCLFGVFRPETTSSRLVKEIKAELIQFDAVIQEKTMSFSP
ncbi:MAG: hypothetical protein REH83_00575 [Rickettsiella sp.]|nr:hypothetical protein [Rickettsiella sp.]